MTIEFTPWPKTPRLFRDAIITEKIDGTNAAVIIEPGDPGEDPTSWSAGLAVDGTFYKVGAQSRKRVLFPGQDNFAFAAWVAEHAEGLVRSLGAGVHFGEWWGHGIQRGYGLAQGDRRFSLFNTHRYAHLTEIPLSVPGLGVVPVLDIHTFDTVRVNWVLSRLREEGSLAAPGFMRPEGVVVFHSAAGSVFKALIENDDTSKGDVQ